MTDRRETPRWEASWALTIGFVAAGASLALAPVMFSSMTDGATMLGLPGSYFLAGVVIPPLIAVVIFWSANGQDRIDRRFDDLQG